MIRFAHESGSLRFTKNYVVDHFRFSHFRTICATFSAMPPSTRLWRIWITAVEAEGANFALRQSDGGDEVLYLGVFE